MNAENFNIKMLLAMAHSPLRNYAIPGLTSSLIGQKSDAGCIRLFENSRDHQENIVPHSHRFDFQCWVLAGSVTNRVWTETDAHILPGGHNTHDLFQVSELRYQGVPGAYETVPVRQGWFQYKDTLYETGQCYGMKAHEIHSIGFSRGAKVLFFEGAQIANSVFIEPVVDGEVIHTFQVAPWMFKGACA